jgi:hypothetical protein
LADTPAVNEIEVVQRVLGNREPYGMQLLDQDGNVVNLAGLTMKFRLVKISDGSEKVADAAATVNDAATGKVSYTFTADDVNTAGRYAAYFLDTTSDPNRRWPYDGAKRIIEIVTQTES